MQNFKSKNFKKIDGRELKLGMKFSAPVFFDDGENMFLAEEKTIKQYHIQAVSRWKIPYLLTFGRILDGSESDKFDDLEELEELDNWEEVEEVEEVEEAEELEEVEEVEELEEV